MPPTTNDVTLPDRLAREGRLVPMPASNAKIASLLLHLDADTRARSLVVQFPAGFARLQPGRYAVGEEFYVLSGALRLNDRELVSGDWCWVPPGALRSEFVSEPGALVYAWFSGRNDFLPASGGQRDTEPSLRSRRLTDTTADLMLRDGEGAAGSGSSALLTAGAPVSGPVEMLELDTCHWSRIEPQRSSNVEGSRALVRWDLA